MRASNELRSSSRGDIIGDAIFKKSSSRGATCVPLAARSASSSSSSSSLLNEQPVADRFEEKRQDAWFAMQITLVTCIACTKTSQTHTRKLNFVILDEIIFLVNFISFLVLQNNSSHSTLIEWNVKNKFCRVPL